MTSIRGAIRRAAWPALAMLLVAGTIAGCGRNKGELPAGFAPDGVPSSSTYLFSQFGYGINPAGDVAPGVLLTVLDASVADGFNLYRKSTTDVSFHEVNTFPAPHVGSFNSTYGAYQAIDFDFKENLAVQYTARSVVQGVESQLSSLSSSSYLPAGTEADLAPDLFNMIAPIDTVNTDSLPTLRWQAVPGAQRYLVQVIRSDFKPFVLILTPPDGSTSYKLQSKLGLVVQEAILTRATFFWDVTAIDANGFVIGVTPSFQIFIVNPPPPPPPM